MASSTSERTIDIGIENNAELIKNFYTLMIFDAGPVTESDVVPVDEVITKTVTATRTGANIEFAGTVDAGDVSEDTTIVAIWLAGQDSEENDVYLVVHEIADTVVGLLTGITYTLPYAITGYSESYDG